MLSERFIPNTLSTDRILSHEVLEEGIESFLKIIDSPNYINEDSRTSIFDGIGGISLMYFHLYQRYSTLREKLLTQQESSSVLNIETSFHKEKKIKTDLNEEIKKSQEKSKYYFNKSEEVLQRALKKVQRKSSINWGHQVSFITGISGLYSLQVTISLIKKEYIKVEEYLNKILSIQKSATENGSCEDELLYGRSGYLFCLLFVRTHLKNSSIIHSISTKTQTTTSVPSSSSSSSSSLNSQKTEEQILSNIVSQIEVIEQYITLLINNIINSGEKYYSNGSLMYEWHKSRYIGAAHGLFGILHTLLSTPQLSSTPFVSHDEKHSVSKNEERKEERKEEDQSIKRHHHSLILNTINFLQSLQHPSGNFPTRGDPERIGRDELVQWCHGGAGAILFFVKAYEIYQDKKYLEVAIKASESIWKRGLLTKGYGLCHGISGNAYSFLTLYQATGSEIYLKKCHSFCWFMLKNPRLEELISTPDHPASLYGGLSGAVCLLADLLVDSKSAKFPGFQL